MRKQHIITAFAVIASCTLCSCNEYIDELQGIGKRVEVLEDSVLSVKNTFETLTLLQKAMETYGVVSNIIQNSDGSTTLEFVDGRTPITFVNGADGKEAEVLLGVAKGPDGKYYWVFNGEFLRDENGNPILAEPLDGKDGKDGVDGKDGEDAKPIDANLVMPQIRINPSTRNWEISTDGGKNWEDTGVCADGKNGKDGKDGADGKDGKDGEDGKDGHDGADGEDGNPDGIFISATYTDNYIIFTLYFNGKVTTVTLKRV